MATASKPSSPGNPLNIGTYLHRTDLAFALALISILVMLIMPMPKVLLDMAIAISITFSVLILMTALFIEKPLDFSVFPTVLLVSTMIRLALNVASTRLILSNGHEGGEAAGKVIKAFAHFLMGGNFVIGIIVFFIVIIVNFVVITKGSGRIAEVSARFSLDAMPGKQMAIDADLSAGLINESEAKFRRKQLEEETNFFGSMDGAAKFVRGDAIAGIMITAINLIGGIVIGVFQMDLTFMEALRNYSMLTVGDGLVSQIPALIVSTGAGMLVAKAGVEGSADQAFIKQLSAFPNALGLSSFLMALLGLIPGIPLFPFALLSAASGYGAWRITQTQNRENAEQTAMDEQQLEVPPPTEEQVLSSSLRIDHIRIELGYGLLNLINPANEGKSITDQIKILRQQLASEIGFVLPSVRIQDNLQVGAQQYVIRIKEMEAGRGEVRANMVMVIDPNGGIIDLPGEETIEPAFGLKAMWIDAQHQAEAQSKGYTVVDGGTVLITHLTEIVKDNLGDLLSYSETQKMFDELGDVYKKLLNDLVPAQITLGGIQRILQNLASERISIRDLPTILEGVAEGCTFSRSVPIITEHVRQRLSRQITFSNVGMDGNLSIITLSPQWEETFQQSLKGDSELKTLAMAPSDLQSFMQKVKQAFERSTLLGENPILVTGSLIRPYVRSVVERARPSTSVLSQSEIHSKAKIKTVGTIN
jgi:flagellar biosynthesis protein FlhA